jgi:hypothetical protein
VLQQGRALALPPSLLAVFGWPVAQATILPASLATPKRKIFLLMFLYKLLVSKIAPLNLLIKQCFMFHMGKRLDLFTHFRLNHLLSNKTKPWPFVH